MLLRLRARDPAARIAVLWDDGPIREAVLLAERVGARTLHIRKDAVTDAAMAAARAATLAVRAWTVNDPRESARLESIGVEGVFTDLRSPDFREVVDEAFLG